MIKYFRVYVDENYTAPQPIGWYGKLDQKSLQGKKAYQIPKHLIFKVEKQMRMVFTDIITFPCFMVSRMVREIIEMYTQDVRFARIIFFDGKNKKSMAYYIPFLDRIELVEEDVIKPQNQKKIFVKGCVLGEHVIVKAEGVDKSCMIMRMDLVESIMRRGAVGIGIEEVEVEDDLPG